MIKITLILDDGSEEDHELPSIMEVCDDCNGETYVLCEGMRGAAYSREDFEESFDEEEREHYFRRGGMYDVLCPTCNGKNVVPVVDEAHLTPEQKEIFQAWEAQEEEQGRWDAEDARTRRMEMGMF